MSWKDIEAARRVAAYNRVFPVKASHVRSQLRQAKSEMYAQDDLSKRAKIRWEPPKRNIRKDECVHDITLSIRETQSLKKLLR